MDRIALPSGTRVRLEDHTVYVTEGAPIGCGATSLIYNVRQLQQDGSYSSLLFSMKECYPLSVFPDVTFTRNEEGEIVESAAGGKNQSGEASGQSLLDQAKQMLLSEAQISQEIYQSTSRILPIRKTSVREIVTFPDGTEHVVRNAVSIMDSFSLRGRSLHDFLREEGRFSTLVAFQIIRHLLEALREIHTGIHPYVHLDIQDANIFLHGALNDDSEQLTLIDFGSARKLTDGKTEPLEVRSVFSTAGFTPPEISACREERIVLTPAADIFSTGCLLYLLLTGEKMTDQEITALQDHPDRPLSEKAMRRIGKSGLAPHLEGRLQEIVSRAVAISPIDRYQSADEMLSEVISFIGAVSPYRSDLSGVKYDAFISYRHTPFDRAAAQELQRSLEHFRAPRGVSQKRYPIERVFLDEGELSSCADFGSQIEAALKNAGWLIVICSPDTPKSDWIANEIATFLRYHDRSRILALLAAGTPETSFPMLLRGDGMGHGEVLAADLSGVGHGSPLPGDEGKENGEGEEAERAQIRKVKRAVRGDALLKIAAPMLGVNFDGLRQRRKTAAIRRRAAISLTVMACVLGFVSYALYENTLLVREQNARYEEEQAKNAAQEKALEEQQARQEEQQKRLEQQGRYMALQAKKKLEDHDTLGAVEMVLESLPVYTEDEREGGDEAMDVPADKTGAAESAVQLSVEARQVLAEGTNAYVSPYNAAGRATAVRQYQSDYTEGETNEELPSQYDSGRNLLMMFFDASGHDCHMNIWDTDTGALVRAKNVGDIRYVPENALDTEHHTIVWAGYDSLVCYDYVEDRTVYELPAAENGYSYCAIEISEDRKLIFALVQKDRYFDEEGQGALVLRVIDAVSGKIRKELSQESVRLSDDYQNRLYRLYISRDNSSVAVQVESDGTLKDAEGNGADPYQDLLLLYDLKKNRTGIHDLDLGQMNTFFFDGNGNIDLILQRHEGSHSLQNGAHTLYADAFRTTLCCYDPEERKVLWEDDAALVMFSKNQKIIDLSNGNALFVFAGSLYRVRLSDGEVLNSWILPAEVVGIRADEKGATAVLRDGTLSTMEFADSAGYNRQGMYPGEIRRATGTAERVFLELDGSDDATEYRFGVSDPGWQERGTEQTAFELRYLGSTDGLYVFLGEDEDTSETETFSAENIKDYLVVYDRNWNRIKKAEIDQYAGIAADTAAGTDNPDDPSKIFLIENQGEPFSELKMVDLTDGHVEDCRIPDVQEEDEMVYDTGGEAGAIIAARISNGSGYGESGEYGEGPELVLSVWEPGEAQCGEMLKVSVSGQTSTDGDGFTYVRHTCTDASGRYVLVVVGRENTDLREIRDTVYLADLQAETVTEITRAEYSGTTDAPDADDRFQMIRWSPDGAYFAAGGNGTIEVYSSKGDRVNRILYDRSRKSLEGLLFTGDENDLLVLYNTDTLELTKYRKEEAEPVQDTYLGETYGFTSSLRDPVVQIGDGQVLVFGEGKAFLTGTDDGSYGSYAACTAVGYDPVGHCVISICGDYPADGISTIGTFRTYSDAELIRLARDMTAGESSRQDK